MEYSNGDRIVVRAESREFNSQTDEENFNRFPLLSL